MANLQKSKSGRPSVRTQEAVRKMEEIFKVGGTVEEARTYAGISRTIYYDWLKEDEDFRIRMEQAQHYADVMAKRNVAKTITEGNVDNSKWWLEKKVWKDGPAVLQQFNTSEMILEFTTDE